MTLVFRRHPRGRPPHPDVLTPAEWRVLEAVREGRSNPEIADHLGLSRNTVKTHVSSILAKLDLRDRADLARWHGEPAPAVARRSLLLTLIWIGSRSPVTAAAMVAAVAVGGFIVAMHSGRVLDDGSESGPIAGQHGTPDAESLPPTPRIVALADLDVPAGRLLYGCGTEWCSIVTDGGGAARLDGLRGTFHLAPSPDGELVAYLEQTTDTRWLGVANADGTAPRRLTEVGSLHDPVPPVWSPDGSTIFVERASEGSGLGDPTAILAVDVGTGDSQVVVGFDMGGSSPAISPDGGTLAFDSDRDGNGDVFTVPVEGGAPRKLTGGAGSEVSPTWLLDGRIVYWAQVDRSGDVFVMNADGTGTASLSDHPANDFVYPVGGYAPPVSPDGKWVAFQSDRSGSTELYIARTDGMEVRQITEAAGQPVGIAAWSPDSRYLVYSATMQGQQGVWITRISDGASAYLTAGVQPRWLP